MGSTIQNNKVSFCGMNGILVDGDNTTVSGNKLKKNNGDGIEIEKDDWVLSFNGRSLGAPNQAGWAVRRDGGEFDQFTGATITPRAVVRAVRLSLEYYRQHRDDLYRDELYRSPPSTTEPGP